MTKQVVCVLAAACSNNFKSLNCQYSNNQVQLKLSRVVCLFGNLSGLLKYQDRSLIRTYSITHENLNFFCLILSGKGFYRSGF